MFPFSCPYCKYENQLHVSAGCKKIVCPHCDGAIKVEIKSVVEMSVYVQEEHWKHHHTIRHEA